MRSSPEHMGVNPIFHSIERTDILRRDQERDTNTHLVLMSVLTLQMCAAEFQVEFGRPSPSPASPLLLVLVHSCSSSETRMAQLTADVVLLGTTTELPLIGKLSVRTCHPVS